jgi:CheY-like chemotaxis protein
MAGKSILLVEDELLLCWVVEEALVEEGHRVTIATTGDGGREALEAGQPFDLLITNIRLKDGPDGWRLSRLARERQPDIPVLYVTGDSAAQHPAEGVPGSVILSKPFDPDALKSAIAGLLEIGQQQRSAE